MPHSSSLFDDQIHQIISTSDYRTFLDIGAGAGKYGRMVRDLKPDTTIDAIEAHGPYCDQFKLTTIYNRLYNQDVTDLYDVFLDKPYDCVIIGDCIEHLRKSQGVDLLNFWYYRAKTIIVIYPTDFVQYSSEGIKSENHVSVWRDADFTPFKHELFKHDQMNLVIIQGLTSNVPVTADPDATIPVIITNFNRLHSLRKMVECISTFTHARIIILDNCSTYPPLLQWYADCPYHVIRLKENMGRLAPWVSGAVYELREPYYVVTDSDLDLTGVPTDVLQHLQNSVISHDKLRAGLSLRIDDLPDTEIGRWAKDWEAQFWTKPLDKGFYEAAIDTTFAIYARSKHDEHFGKEEWTVHNSIRTAAPYQCRHLQWYLTPETMTEEETYYLDHSNATDPMYRKVLRPQKLIKAPITFTIITATTGARASLIQTCKSVRDQSYHYWEHLIAVDAPIDNFAPTAVTDARCALLFVPGGPHKDYGHAARNFACGKARGDYIIYIDDDDYLQPEALDVLNAQIQGEVFGVFPIDFCGERNFLKLPPKQGQTAVCQFYHRRMVGEKAIIFPDINAYDTDSVFAEQLATEYGYCVITAPRGLAVVEKLNQGANT